MNRKHNLMVAALVAVALASAWFFADAGHAPFSRKGMAVPEEEAEAEAPVLAHQTHVPTAEELERILDALERRTELAATVEDAAGAYAFIELVKTQKGVTKQASDILFLLQQGIDCGEDDQEPVIFERLERIEKVFTEHLQAMNGMYTRMYDADGYGDPLLQTCLAFNGAVMLNLAADQTLAQLYTRRKMAEWERLRAQEEAEEGEAGNYGVPELAEEP